MTSLHPDSEERNLGSFSRSAFCPRTGCDGSLVGSQFGLRVSGAFISRCRQVRQVATLPERAEITDGRNRVATLPVVPSRSASRHTPGRTQPSSESGTGGAWTHDAAISSVIHLASYHRSMPSRQTRSVGFTDRSAIRFRSSKMLTGPHSLPSDT